MTLLKTLGFLALVPGTVLILLPYEVAASTSPAATIRLGVLGSAACPAWILGGGMLLWSAVNFVFKGRGTPAPIDPPKELVAVGFYKFTRNPMYVGALAVLLGHFLWFQSLWLLLYAACFFLASHLFVVCYEEPALTKTFGESYIRYCATTPRWLPIRRRKS